MTHIYRIPSDSGLTVQKKQKGKLFLFFIFLSGFLFHSCISQKNTAIKEADLKNEKAFCYSLTPVTDMVIGEKSDSFIIKDVYINENCINIEVLYSGGCGDVEMLLFYNEVIIEQEKFIRLIPVFSDHDPCRSEVKGLFRYDLKEFEHRARAEKIVFQMDGYDKKLVFALPLH